MAMWSPERTRRSACASARAWTNSMAAAAMHGDEARTMKRMLDSTRAIGDPALTSSQTAKWSRRLEIRSIDVLDCPRPIDHILGRHIPAWYDPGVLIAVLADVEEILGARGECAPADAFVARRCVELSLESRQQLAGDMRRDAVPLGW